MAMPAYAVKSRSRTDAKTMCRGRKKLPGRSQEVFEEPSCGSAGFWLRLPKLRVKILCLGGGGPRKLQCDVPELCLSTFTAVTERWSSKKNFARHLKFTTAEKTQFLGRVTLNK